MYFSVNHVTPREKKNLPLSFNLKTEIITSFSLVKDKLTGHGFWILRRVKEMFHFLPVIILEDNGISLELVQLCDWMDSF